MNNNPDKLLFSKAILTAVFAGIIATLACFVFDIYYRLATWYGPSGYINVSSIIFIVNILFIGAGVAYYGFKSWSKKGDYLYFGFVFILIAAALWKTTGIDRFADHRLNLEFIQLLSGTLGIIGFFMLCIPFIFNNRRMVDLYYDPTV